MNNFLKSLAQYYINNYETNISDFCFVFPGRRAGLFFQKYLSELSDKPFWSPKILTISEFIEELTELQIPDQLSLLFDLYKIHNEKLKSNTSFDDFFHWGEMLLNDFDDADKYLVDIKKLFSNLSDLKEIEDDYSFLSEDQIEAIRTFWRSFNPEQLSNHQNDFLNIWTTLYDIYSLYKERLSSKQQGYTGMIYRQIAEKIKLKQALPFQNSKYIFAAFNALNPSEKTIFNHLKLLNKADFFWDYSEYMLQRETFTTKENTNKQHTWLNESGLFIQQNILDFPSPEDWNQPFSDQLPELTVTAVASDTAQTQETLDFLENTSSKPLYTGVILADENLLLPVLHCIPEIHTKVNVTMGYPLSNTPVAGLIEQLHQLQKNARTTKAGKTWFYFRDVQSILNHQYITSSPLSSIASKLSSKIITENKIYIEKSFFNTSPILSNIFLKIIDSKDLSTYLLEHLHYFASNPKNSDNTSPLHQEFIFHHYLSIKRLTEILSKHEIEISPETWLKLFRKICDSQTIPFNGEPLNGLQIMGLMETRALDFKEIIILSLNEGTFPATSAPNSFIPYNLRKGFGMPTIEHQDAIFAYYFYRLIHRAEKVKFVYNSNTQGMKSGEMSRYLYQLIYEYQGKLTQETAVDEVTISMSTPTFATKTEEVIEKLHQFKAPNKRSLSPSALSNYIECPLRFYYQKIVNIQEMDEVTDEIDPRIFGNLFHNSVEHLYTPYKGKSITSDTIEHLLKSGKEIDKAIIDAFTIHFGFSPMNNLEFKNLQGKNILIYEILKKYIRKFLQQEKKATPIKIYDLERKVEINYQVNSTLNVNLGGIIDRMDSINNKNRIVDYKTGAGEMNFKEVEDLFSQSLHKAKKAIFQTGLYSIIVSKTDANFSSPTPAVIWMRHLYNKDYTTDITMGERQNKKTINFSEIGSEFENQLKQLLEELFNSEIPFIQTDKKEHCEMCSYKKLCNK